MTKASLRSRANSIKLEAVHPSSVVVVRQPRERDISRRALRWELGAKWAVRPDLRNGLAGVYMNRGTARRASRAHGPDAAIADYDAAITLMEELRRDLRDTWAARADLRNDLAGAYMNRGTARQECQAHGPDAAVADYGAAITLMEELRRDLRDTWAARADLRNDLAGAYMNRGTARQESQAHGPDAAVADYGAAIALREELRRDLGAIWAARPDLRNGLAAAYMDRGNARQASREHGPDAAISDHDAAITLREEIRSDLGAAWPARPDLRKDLAAAYMNRATLVGRAGHTGRTPQLRSMMRRSP
jgi:hypothetical protein